MSSCGYDFAKDEASAVCLSSSGILERVMARFLQSGGEVRTETQIHGICVSGAVGAAIDVGEFEEPITSKLLIDCMGKSSPVLSQSHASSKPDGLCVIVGTSSAGFDSLQSANGDIVCTMDTTENDFSNGKMQYIFEAPTSQDDDKVIYMFTFMDSDQDRPSLESLVDDYWTMLPKYQPCITNPEYDLDVQQFVLAYFPTYEVSPLLPPSDRIFPICDTSGIESPLCFGSLGATCRHIDWSTAAIYELFSQNKFQKDCLSEIYSCAPILSSAWMYQKAAEIKKRHLLDKAFLKRLLSVKIEKTSGMVQNTRMTGHPSVTKVLNEESSTQHTRFGHAAPSHHVNNSILRKQTTSNNQPSHRDPSQLISFGFDPSIQNNPECSRFSRGKDLMRAVTDNPYNLKDENPTKEKISAFGNDSSILNECNDQHQSDHSEKFHRHAVTREEFDKNKINSNAEVVRSEKSTQDSFTLGDENSPADINAVFGCSNTQHSQAIRQALFTPEIPIQAAQYSGTSQVTLSRPEQAAPAKMSYPEKNGSTCSDMMACEKKSGIQQHITHKNNPDVRELEPHP